MKAVKTEYKGIVFDSKSEAVFARALDLAGYKWKYHVEHCGHEWDFKVHCSSYFGVPTSVLVEYKPSAPTRTYVDNLTDSQRKDPVESMIIWGNPWTGPVVESVDANGDRSLEDLGNYCYVPYPVFCKEMFDCSYSWGEFEPLYYMAGAIFHYDGMRRVMPKLTLDIALRAKEYRFDLQ
jgi:hypothetical protein